MWYFYDLSLYVNSNVLCVYTSNSLGLTMKRTWIFRFPSPLNRNIQITFLLPGNFLFLWFSFSAAFPVENKTYICLLPLWDFEQHDFRVLSWITVSYEKHKTNVKYIFNLDIVEKYRPLLLHFKKTFSCADLTIRITLYSLFQVTNIIKPLKLDFF